MFPSLFPVGCVTPWTGGILRRSTKIIRYRVVGKIILVVGMPVWCLDVPSLANVQIRCHRHSALIVSSLSIVKTVVSYKKIMIYGVLLLTASLFVGKDCVCLLTSLTWHKTEVNYHEKSCFLHMICKTKSQISCMVTAQLISAFWFRYIYCTIHLLPKSQILSL